MRISMYMQYVLLRHNQWKKEASLPIFKTNWLYLRLYDLFIIIYLSLKATNTVEEKPLPSATRTFRINFIK